MIKKANWVTFFSLLATFIFLSCVEVFAFSGAGSGTESDPYIITTREQLLEIKDDLTAAYKFGNDIDMEGIEIMPIGTDPAVSAVAVFSGILEGDGYKIKDLYVSSRYDLGLFSRVGNGSIKNIIFENPKIISTVPSVGEAGVIAGYVSNSTIKNCAVIGGSVTNMSRRTGGICGYLVDSSIQNCYSTASVTATGLATGGLVGNATRGNIENSFVVANITASGSALAYAGGLVGMTTSSATHIKNSYFSGDISADMTNLGGLMGNKKAGSPIKNSYYNADACSASLTISTGAKTQEEMQTLETYSGSGWDFNNVWVFDAEEYDYPYLQTLPLPYDPDLKISDFKGAASTTTVGLTWAPNSGAE